MRSAQIHEYGAPDVFTIEDVAEPEPGPKDVRIDVFAAGVNPIDWKIRQGTQRAFIRYRLPWTLGLEVSGVVSAVGAKVTDFAVGDEVYASLDYKRPGGYAEQVLCDARFVARKPGNLSHIEAVALPLAGLTAWQSLIGAGRLSAGEHVLIQAGSGGVGTLAIQIAKAKGAHVTTTCSTRNVSMVGELGADRVIDYTSEDYAEVVRDQDLVLDSLGGEARRAVLPCLKRGGRHISIVSDIPAHVERHGATLGTIAAMSKLGCFKLNSRLRRGVRSKLVVQRPNGEQLAELTKLAESGELRPMIDSVFALDTLDQAHALSQTKRARGKIAIRVRDQAG